MEFKKIIFIAIGAIFLLIFVIIILTIISKSFGSKSTQNSSDSEDSSPTKSTRSTKTTDNDELTDQPKPKTTPRSIFGEESPIDNPRNSDEPERDPLKFLEDSRNNTNHVDNTNPLSQDTDDDTGVIVTCYISISDSNDDRVIVELDSDSREADVSQMQIWTTSHKNTTWRTYRSKYTITDFDEDDRIYAKFRDEDGNTSRTCSVSI